MVVQNGNGTDYKVNSAIIKIDGVEIVGASEFKKKPSKIVKGICDLKLTSIIEVVLTGSPNQYLEIWIEGTRKKMPPVLTTNSVTEVTSSSAKCGGTIIYDGSYDITSKGICWSTAQNPTLLDNITDEGAGNGTYTSSIIGLSPATTYYIRAYATNFLGTSYGNQISFTTQNMTDIDGNIYHTVTIGTQVWMVENLKTTKYNDGNIIQNPPITAEWNALTTGAYCWYSKDEMTYKSTYGALYNWYAVNTGKLCPVGWHVPSYIETNTLVEEYCGGFIDGGGNMKEIGTIHWQSPNTGATNLSGFTGLPGGYHPGDFYDLGTNGNWWTSTEWNVNNNLAVEV